MPARPTIFCSLTKIVILTALVLSLFISPFSTTFFPPLNLLFIITTILIIFFYFSHCFINKQFLLPNHFLTILAIILLPLSLLSAFFSPLNDSLSNLLGIHGILICVSLLLLCLPILLHFAHPHRFLRIFFAFSIFLSLLLLSQAIATLQPTIFAWALIPAVHLYPLLPLAFLSSFLTYHLLSFLNKGKFSFPVAFLPLFIIGLLSILLVTFLSPLKDTRPALLNPYLSYRTFFNLVSSHPSSSELDLNFSATSPSFPLISTLLFGTGSDTYPALFHRFAPATTIPQHISLPSPQGFSLLFHSLPTLGIFISTVFCLFFVHLYRASRSNTIKNPELFLFPLVIALFLLIFPLSPSLLLLLAFFTSLALSFQKKDSLPFSSLPTPVVILIHLLFFALLSYLLFALNQVIKVLRFQQKSLDIYTNLSQISSSDNDYLLVFDSLNTQHHLTLQSARLFPQSAPLSRLASLQTAKLALYQNFLDNKHLVTSSQIQTNLDTLLTDSLNLAQHTLSRHPHDAQNWANLALINHQFYPLTQNSQFREQAISAYQMAILLNPFYIDAYLQLGSLYLETSAYEQAVSVYTAALALDQHSAPIYYHLAHAYHQLYDLENAYQAYQLAFNTLDKNDPSYQENVSLIQTEIQQLGYTP